MSQVTNGNSTTAGYAYNTRNWITSLTNKNSSLNVLSSFTYAFDNVGNRATMTEANGNVTTYTYAAAYQLTRELKKNNLNVTLYDTSYTFDDNGNTLSKTVNAQTTNYTYNYENWLTQITYPNSSTNTFSYDGSGIRFSKTDSSGTLKYVDDPAWQQKVHRPETPQNVNSGNTVGPRAFDGENQVQQQSDQNQQDGYPPLLAELDGTNALVTAYTNGANGLVSQRRNGVSRFYHFDALGSTRQLTDGNQTVTDNYSYDAYGNITGQGGSSTNPAKYVGSQGYYGDGDSGLHLLGQRYYDPTTGRFITLDPIKDGVNWYAYCGNNPVNRVDPTGFQWQVWVVVIVVVIVLIVGVIAGRALIRIGQRWVRGTNTGTGTEVERTDVYQAPDPPPQPSQNPYQQGPLPSPRP